MNTLIRNAKILTTDNGAYKITVEYFISKIMITHTGQIINIILKNI